METIDLRNELDTICARVRLLKMMFLGASASGIDFSDDDNLSAIVQQTTDVIDGLESLDERIAKAPA